MAGKKGTFIQKEWAELAVFFFIILLPAISSSFHSLFFKQQGFDYASLYSPWGFFNQIQASIPLGLLAAFLLVYGDHDPSYLALRSSKLSVIRQIMAGVGLWFVYYLFFTLWDVVAALAQIHVPHINFHSATPLPQETMLNGVFALVNGISEEVMRVYLLAQIGKLTTRRWVVVLITAILISSYHSYQGGFTLIAFLVANIFLSSFYLSSQSLLALCVWHILADFSHPTALMGWNVLSGFIGGSFIIGTSWVFGHLGIKI